MSHTNDNKRLAKNTIVLYLRTIAVTLITLFISRILLKNLGVEDYGLYNVVGSIVVLFSFLNSALTTSTQRFLTVALGKQDKEEMKKIFRTSLSIQLLLVLIVILIIEIFGIWFINNKLNIPSTRMNAAIWAFHFSIITFSLNVVKIPYNATIIAYERMGAFAYLCIIDVCLKLLIAYLLGFGEQDKLILYAALLALESAIMFLLYYLYCKKHFVTCGFKFGLDKSVAKGLVTFTGWSTFGSLSNILTQNGLLFVLNIFCGVIVNAAMGIANQVLGAINSFISSFQTSFYPQIIKSYACGDKKHMFSLITRTSKLSYELIIIPALLIIINIDLILDIWLIDVPEYTNVFCQMILICAVIDALTGPFYCGIMATGRIKAYQIAISISFMMDILFVYLMLGVGISPRYVLISRILTRGLINAGIGLYFLRTLLLYNVGEYIKRTMLPVFVQLVVVLPFVIVLCNYFNGWQLMLLSGLYVVLGVFVTAFFVVFDNSERHFVSSFFKRILNNKNK